MIFDDILDQFKIDPTVLRTFTKEQKQILLDLFKSLKELLNWHSSQEEQPHQDTIGQEIFRLQEKLKEHRYNLNEPISGKAIFKEKT